MKTNKSYKTLFASTGIIGFLFLFSTQLSFAITDTTKVKNQKYELDDPRNPNCPCHKLQKQAEDEFAQQNKTDNQLVYLGNSNENKQSEKEEKKSISPNQSDEKLTRTNFLASTNIYKRKKKIGWLTKIKFRFSKNSHRIKRIVPDYEICFKW